MGHTMEESKQTLKNSYSTSFRHSLQVKTKRWWTTGENGIEVRASSLKSLKRKTGDLIAMNQAIRKVKLNSENGSWKKSKPIMLLEEYFDTCNQTQVFCHNLDRCLKSVQNRSHLFIGDEDEAEIWNEMKNFKQIRVSIMGEIEKILTSAITHQNLMLQHCQNRSERLDKKIKRLQKWKRTTRVLFLSAVGCVLIISVVAAAVSAPAIVTAVAGVAAAPIGSTGKLIDSFWSKREKVLEGEKNMVGSIETGTSLLINDLDSIMITIGKLDDDIGEMLRNKMESAEEKRAAKIRIIKQLDDVAKIVDQIGNRNDLCRQDLENVKSAILEKWVESPN